MKRMKGETKPIELFVQFMAITQWLLKSTSIELCLGITTKLGSPGSSLPFKPSPSASLAGSDRKFHFDDEMTQWRKSQKYQ